MNNIAIISTVLALISIGIAIGLRYKIKGPNKEAWKIFATCFVGLWAIGPFVWFFYEDTATQTVDAETLKKLQDGARNIWTVYVLLLANIIGIKWEGKGEN